MRRDRINLARANNVQLSVATGLLARIRTAERVVNCSSQRRKIAVSHRLGGNRKQQPLPLPQPETFVVYEVKGLVFAVVHMRQNYRTTQRSAELVLRECAGRNAGSVIKKRVRVQVFVSEEFENIAMQIICPGFGGEIYHSACGSAVLRRQIVFLHIEFLDDILRWYEFDRMAERDDHRCAIQHPIALVCSAATDLEVAVGRIVCRRPSGLPGLSLRHHAWGKRDQRQWVASVQRKLVNGALRDYSSYCGVIGLDHFRASRYGHFLLRLAHLQREILANALRYIDVNIGVDLALKSGCFHSYFVGSGNDKLKGIETRTVGLGADRDVSR